MAKEELSNLLQMAKDNDVSQLVDILAQVKEFDWQERPVSTYGGSLRYQVRTEPRGERLVLFGMNVSSEAHPLHGSLCVWIRPEIAARYSRASVANVRAELDEFAPLEMKGDKCFFRVSDATRAVDLLKLLESWSAHADSAERERKVTRPQA